MPSTKPNRWHTKRKDTPAERARDARYRTPEYRAAERRYKAQVEAGNGYCWRCGGWINPAMKRTRVVKGKVVPVRAWHVGHDTTGTRIMGPEHDLTCNLSTAARKGADTVNRRQVVSRLAL